MFEPARCSDEQLALAYEQVVPHRASLAEPPRRPRRVNRGLHWQRKCAEISKLRITREPRSTAIEQPLAAGAGPIRRISLQPLHVPINTWSGCYPI